MYRFRCLRALSQNAVKPHGRGYHTKAPPDFEQPTLFEATFSAPLDEATIRQAPTIPPEPSHDFSRSDPFPKSFDACLMETADPPKAAKEPQNGRNLRHAIAVWTPG